MKTFAPEKNFGSHIPDFLGLQKKGWVQKDLGPKSVLSKKNSW